MTERHNQGSFEQGVMVDVGAGAGALVIYTSDELTGEEIEISPLGHDERRVHTDVLPRKISGGQISAAVFGSLAEGEYRLWHRSQEQPATVRIVSAEVTELDWR
jgi:hypothetical protein